MNRDLAPQTPRPYQLTEWLIYIIVAVAAILLLLLPISLPTRLEVILVLIAVVVYTLLLIYWFLPRFQKIERVQDFLTLPFAFAIGAAYFFLYPLDVDMLFTVMIAGAASRAGIRAAVLVAALGFAIDMIVGVLRTDITTTFLVSRTFHLLIFSTLALLTGSMVSAVRHLMLERGEDDRNLAFLVSASRYAGSSSDLDQALPSLAEAIAKGLSATFCRIALLDEKRQHLVTVGVYPLRPVGNSNLGLRKPYLLDPLVLHRRAIESRQVIVVRQDDPTMAMTDQERHLLFFGEIQSACLVPITLDQQAIGVLSVGEIRNWARAPFDQVKLGSLQMLAAEIGSITENARLHRATQRQAERLAVLNQVARAVGSTLEMPTLLELIYQQLSRVIQTDTYYVALYAADTGVVDLRILIDEGERFPPREIPAGKGLLGLVMRERKPLLIRDLRKERSDLNIEPLSVGNSRLSASWLGVPILARDQLLGALVVCSYQASAFGDDDLELLTGLAEQVALALDNAYHHAQVEEQSRRDSLTGAYTHGYFLTRLAQLIAQGKAIANPVSLLMLDVDHFKEYNDSYGHVMGDEVLRNMTHIIQAHLKSADALGRWGGEEFGIVLPNASTAQAAAVAGRIRHTMAELKLVDRHGCVVPAPTISQGVATFPDHATDVETLVDLADSALYQAKSRGRDQVVIASALPKR